MEFQHVNVKLLLDRPETFDLEMLVPVLHGWIRDKVFDELLLDIADYRHVHQGPGIVLIGHQGDYAIEDTDGRFGIRYNRKAALEGSNQDRLKQATRAALNACQRLESDPSLQGALRFDGKNIEVFINDRLLAPNNEATRAAAEPEFRTFFDALVGSDYSLSFNDDARRLVGLCAKASRQFPVAELFTRL